MHALLLNQYYPPDTAPTGLMLHDLARTLVKRGHVVDVICSQRSYDGEQRYPTRELREGVRVRRLAGLGGNRGRSWMRLAGDASFLASLLVELLSSGGQLDMVMALTTPPYVGLSAAAMASLRGARAVHWVMDIYPDVMAAHGMLDRRGLVYRGLQRLTHLQLRRAALVLTPGPVMAERMDTYIPPTCRSEWVPLWSGVESVGPTEVARARQARGWGTKDLVLMYSGNMGLGHQFGEFLESARRLGRSGPTWVFVGGGPRRGEVESFAIAHPEARLQLFPYVRPEDLDASLSAADVHLISLKRGWEGLLVPSKFQAAFAVGRPVLFVGPEESEIGRWIQESGGGWVIGEGDVEGVLTAVELARDPAERARRGRAGHAFARQHFNRRTNSERIAALLEELGQGTAERAACDC